MYRDFRYKYKTIISGAERVVLQGNMDSVVAVDDLAPCVAVLTTYVTELSSYPDRATLIFNGAPGNIQGNHDMYDIGQTGTCLPLGRMQLHFLSPHHHRNHNHQ